MSAAALAGAFVLATLDILMVNTAFSSTGREPGGGISALLWMVDGYALVFASLLLCAGNLSDCVGARRAVEAGIVLPSSWQPCCRRSGSARPSAPWPPEVA